MTSKKTLSEEWEVKLTEEWVLRFAEIHSYDKETIMSLFGRNILNPIELKKSLIISNATFLTQVSKISKRALVKELAARYNTSSYRIESILYNKENVLGTEYFCSICGCELSKYHHYSRKGYCEKCVKYIPAYRL